MRGWREAPACVTIRWDVQRVAHAEAVVFQALGFGKMESYPAWFVAFNARCERLDVAPGGLVQKELSRTANPNPNPHPHPNLTLTRWRGRERRYAWRGSRLRIRVRFRLRSTLPLT